MYTEKEIERWYLGLPFDESGTDERAVMVELIPLPTVITSEEAERVYLGLTLEAA